MEIRDMNMAEVVERLSQLDAEVRESQDLEAIEKATEEKRMLLERKLELEAVEERKAQALAIQNGNAEPEAIIERGSAQKEVVKMSKIEERANQLVETGKMTLETRALLSSGVLTPAAVKEDIGELPAVVCSIVDDVNAVMVDGVGSYSFAYQNTDAAAAAVTEGSAIGGTAMGFASASISPATWGIVDTISNLVSKKSPLAYEAAIRNRAYVALRKYAKSKIVANVLANANSLCDTVTLTLDATFVRKLVLGFNADESVAGGTKLYLCKQDLQTLGALRGTNEKKPVFDITFTDENNGQIKDGGLVVNFSICSDLYHCTGSVGSETNQMIYGQPKAITMPLWGNYEITTDEGGKYFEANLKAIRGLQTAGADVTVKHAIQIIN